MNITITVQQYLQLIYIPFRSLDTNHAHQFRVVNEMTLPLVVLQSVEHVRVGVLSQASSNSYVEATPYVSRINTYFVTVQNSYSPKNIIHMLSYVRQCKCTFKARVVRTRALALIQWGDGKICLHPAAIVQHARVHRTSYKYKYNNITLHSQPVLKTSKVSHRL